VRLLVRRGAEPLARLRVGAQEDEEREFAPLVGGTDAASDHKSFRRVESGRTHWNLLQSGEGLPSESIRRLLQRRLAQGDAWQVEFVTLVLKAIVHVLWVTAGRLTMRHTRACVVSGEACATRSFAQVWWTNFC
jgi:hypothetical protein